MATYVERCVLSRVFHIGFLLSYSKASVNDTHVSDQDFPSLAGGRAVVIIHYAIIKLAS